PLAMVILGVTLVPFLHGAKVFTAYQYLERRFDAKTRSLTSLLFLLARGMSCGTIIAAPAVVFSAVFGWDLVWSVAIMGIPTVLYTMIGGVQAVTWVDVKQMVLIVLALVAVAVVLLVQLPVSPDDALAIAGANGRARVFDFSFNLNETYTFWSGVIGGTFLMLSYFGTDQSQVQRYLTAKSVDQARSSLLMSAYWKIPLQALVLLVGVLVFVFYLFQAPPLLFNPAHERAVRHAEPGAIAALEARYGAALAQRQAAAQAVARARDGDDGSAVTVALDGLRARAAGVETVRGEALALAARVTGEPSRDVNYVMPSFVLRHLPLGLAGIFIAAVLAAAMSSIAAELNSLATVTVIDFYRRWVRPEGSDRHVCLRGGDLCRDPGVADRGGEPLRVLLLRLDPGRLPVGHGRAGTARGRLRRPDRGDGGGGGGELRGAVGVVPVAQRHRGGDGGRRRRGAQRSHKTNGVDRKDVQGATYNVQRGGSVHCRCTLHDARCTSVI
ncbi:MAG: hypothetical protein HYW52_12240, partial [Gemmatimonadetes bacterium]|nr:hypothetical protein [Gemmatimonadota bacterium]